MDVLGFEVPLWLLLVISCCVLIYMYGNHPRTIWKGLGVPSPPCPPFIGHMSQMFDPVVGTRRCFKNWIDRHGKMFGILYFRQPCLVVTDTEILKELFVKDFNNYSDRFIASYENLWQPIMKKGVFFNRGQDWKRIRRIMTPSFSSAKLKLLTGYINTTAQQLSGTLLQHAEAGTYPDAKVVFAAFSLDVLAGTAFGLELDSQNNVDGIIYQHAKGMMTFPQSLKVILGAEGMFPILGRILKMMNVTFLNDKAVQYFEKFLTKLVSERKADPDQFKDVDFLQFLLNAEADETDDLEGSKKLTVEEIVAQGIVFLLAGYETTSTTLQWLSYEVALNQDIQKRLKKEIEDVMGDDHEVSHEHCLKLKYMEAVINESLRMYPPLINITRQATQDSTLNGMPVPAGTPIFIPVYNIGRDPGLFEDPDTFNPDRFMDPTRPINPIAFLPFGFGPRQCIGNRLAMMQMKIALVHVLQTVTIVDVTPRDVEIEDFSGILVPKIPIQMILCQSD